MRTHSWLAVAVVVPALALGNGQMDHEFLQGTWVLDSAVGDGGEPPKGMKLIITKDEIRLLGNGLDQKFILKIDTSQSPKSLDFLDATGNGKRIATGIYRLAGAEWTYCFANFEGTRPKGFMGKNGQRLWVLKREGP